LRVATTGAFIDTCGCCAQEFQSLGVKRKAVVQGSPVGERMNISYGKTGSVLQLIPRLGRYFFGKSGRQNEEF
jgi:hypothetical protein